MNEDFKKRTTFTYEPKGLDEHPFEKRSGSLDPYLGSILGPPVLEEMKAWASILECLMNGLPKPFDNTVIVDKIIKLERKTGEDLSILKNCCPPSAEVREAKELKPIIFGILDRVVDITGIEEYINKYK